MADNVNITPGTGNIIAADEVVDGTLGTVKVQYTKLMDGTLNSTNKATVSAGGALLVDATATIQPISGTVTANAGTGTMTVGQATGTNLHVVVDSAPSTAVTGSVTANAGTNLNTSALALDTTVSGLQVAQASTTSGQKGGLMLGAVTTSVPAYSNGQSDPISINTGGLLRITSSNNQNALADNLTTQLILNNENGTIAASSSDLCLYGGKFAGTADGARQGWSKARTPTVFRTVQATASGNTAVWTAGTGNKWRLLAYRIEITSNASLASGAVLTVKFQDVSADINITHDVFVPTTAVTTAAGDAYDSGWTSLGTFGILAGATATALNINLSAALATGNVRVITAGTEE